MRKLAVFSVFNTENEGLRQTNSCGILRKASGFCDKVSVNDRQIYGEKLNLSAAWALLP